MTPESSLPATKEDLARLRAEMKEDLAQVRAEMKEDLGQAKVETLEAMRDMQSEILRGLEAFARGNFARMHRLETSDTDTAIRLTALEERVLYLETRRPAQ
jgi:hypothetical protein